MAPTSSPQTVGGPRRRLTSFLGLGLEEVSEIDFFVGTGDWGTASQHLESEMRLVFDDSKMIADWNYYVLIGGTGDWSISPFGDSLYGGPWEPHSTGLAPGPAFLPRRNAPAPIPLPASALMLGAGGLCLGPRLDAPSERDG